MLIAKSALRRPATLMGLGLVEDSQFSGAYASPLGRFIDECDPAESL
jgi:hypothetical protein